MKFEIVSKELKDNTLPTHPGELIADEIEFAEMPLEEAAKKLGISTAELKLLINAEIPITRQVAQNADKLFNLESGMLLKLQADRDEMTSKIKVFNDFSIFSEKLHDKNFDIILSNLQKVLFKQRKPVMA
ncbi:MAG: hypothetical protein IKO99_06170 [Bacteroidales bacterium]|nr:hypothetical protein [Bacteroidales bacterium]